MPAGAGPGATQPSAGLPARDIQGTSPSGGPLEIRIGDAGPIVLLAFLATKCDGCDAFWGGLGGGAEPVLPADVVPVVVTRGPGSEAVAEVAQAASPAGGSGRAASPAGGSGRVPVVMSDQAWADYRVLGYPFFVLVDPSTRSVIAETVGFGWDDLVAFVGAVVE